MAFEEKPIRITIIAVSAVFRISLLFPETYQTDPARTTSIIRLKTVDSVRTHIPLKNSAAKEKIAILF
jgi:hypothetical protein